MLKQRKIKKRLKVSPKFYEGKQFNHWKILDFVEIKRNSAGANCGRIYKVECLVCQNTFVRRVEEIFSGKSKSCKSCSVSIRYSNENNKILGNKSKGWRGTQDIPQSAFTKILYGAEKRGLEFNITIDDLQELWDLQEGRCYFTNKALLFNNKAFRLQKDRIYNFASLDRIDSNKGYTRDNICWVLMEVNSMKNSYSISEFLEVVTEIFENSKNIDIQNLLKSGILPKSGKT